MGQPIVTTIHSINCINQDEAAHGCGQLAILAMGYDYGKLLTMAAIWGLQEVTTTPYIQVTSEAGTTVPNLINKFPILKHFLIWICPLSRGLGLRYM